MEGKQLKSKFVRNTDVLATLWIQRTPSGVLMLTHKTTITETYLMKILFAIYSVIMRGKDNHLQSILNKIFKSIS